MNWHAERQQPEVMISSAVLLCIYFAQMLKTESDLRRVERLYFRYKNPLFTDNSIIPMTKDFSGKSFQGSVKSDKRRSFLYESNWNCT